MANVDIYEMVTNKIMEKLEQGIIPWRKPWVNGGAVNWKTQKAYRGINTMLLEPGEYATFKQISEAGGKVKKGAKSEIVVFWKWLEKEEDGKIEKIPFLRYYRVFDINKQVEGLKSKRNTESFEHDPIAACEDIVKGYVNGPKMRFESVEAWYKPMIDLINVPPIKDFPKIEEHYSTLFHEMIHSTGHKKRLNREGITDTVRFGSETYSKEELIAEMGAAMLCGVAQIENTIIDNSTAYIQSWLKALKDDKTLLVKAGSAAQKATDHILGITFDGE
ncbi:zincin-like metallopeptidase domain-containing protein [Peribacillus frigoritolerans]|uniref:ArdC family protein n=1 Tax=Peribacillus frigoritolerans TaxID=450367 RepID=UPI0021CE23C6|nr:zincin-like metallopeptidase domain-containing protein [Peribacillus frigoritolerans]MCU6603831.1 zincin-like metallopeptidase domain-containing protein [Peribacillus frigoritolerans]